MLRKLPLLCFLFINLVLPAQSILWRISGKGLSKPSYLYGTMHIKDKRIFQVNDSLMKYLDACDLFATELHPDSLNRMLYGLMNQKDTSDERSYYSSEDYELVNRKLKKELGLDLSRVKSKNYRMLKMLMSEGKARSDDYPTFLDGYLGEIARRKHKTLIGLESISIHTEAFASLSKTDELYRKDLVNLSREDKALNQYDELLKNYLKGDIAKMQEQTTDYNYALQYDLIYNRNRYMAHTIDSVLKGHTLFATCGAAHLGGKDGLVQMLKDMGYTLTPISQAGKTYLSLAGLAISFDSWQKISAPALGYSYEMPGEPSAYLRTVMYADLKTYTDIGSGATYLVLPAAVTTDAGNVQKVYDDAFKRMEQQAGTTLKAPKKVSYKGIEGMEIEYPSIMGQALRMRMFVTNNILYSFTVTYPAGNEHREETDHFFNSVSFFKPVKGELYTYTNTRWAVELQLPAKPEEKVSVEKIADTRREGLSLKASDNIDGVHYLLECGDVGPGHYYPHDSVVLGRVYDTYKNSELVTFIKDSAFTFQGAKVRQTVVHFNDNSMLVSRSMMRGYRYYDLMAIMRQEKGAEHVQDAVLASFRFLPVPPGEFTEYKTPFDSSLFIRLPQPFYTPARDSLSQAFELGEDKDPVYRAYDFKTGLTYYLSRMKSSDYSYTQSDSAFWKEQEQAVLSYDDTLLRARPVQIGEMKARELTIKARGTDCISRVLLLPFGNATYQLYTYLPETDSLNERMLQPFHNIRYSQYKRTEQVSDTVAFRKLVTDMFSPDTILREKARGKVGGFSVTDNMFKGLTMVLDTMTQQPGDTGIYAYGLRHQLIYKLNTIRYPGKVAYAVTKLNNSKAPVAELRAYTMVLRTAATAEAYDGLKTFYMANLQRLSEFYGASDSLALVSRLFPDLLEAYAKEETGNYYFDLDVLHLLDTGLLAYKAVMPYEEQIMARSLKLAAEDVSSQYSGYRQELLGILDHATDKEKFYAHCQTLIKGKSAWARLYATVFLLKNKQAVEPAVLNKLAADPYLRRELFLELKRINAEILFPQKYATQQSLAEADLYYTVYEESEDEIKSIHYIDRYLLDANGKKEIYYAFKVKLKYSEMKQAMMGFAGPYEPNTLKLQAKAARTGVNYVPYKKGEEQTLLQAYTSGNYGSD